MFLRSKKIFALFGINAGIGVALAPRSIFSARNRPVYIGSFSMIAARFSFDRPEAQILVGNRCFIGKSHLVAAKQIIIEDDVLISWGVTIVDHNSHSLNVDNRSGDVLSWLDGAKDWSDVKIGPVRIQKNSWIGFNAMILKGVTVGEGAVVGAGAVVTKDVPPFTAVAGNPAVVVRELPRSSR